VDFGLKCISEKHSESARELFEHLDCKDDQRGLAKLDELLEYTFMLVQYMNDWKREHNVGNQAEQVHSPRTPDKARL
jgi:hypothetical protein